MPIPARVLRYPFAQYSLLLSLFLASPESHAAAVLEEVIVTAQLREQSLQDVPVSVSAIAGDKMQEAGLARIEDLQAYVPNFTMSESGLGTDIYIRGIGSGENQGFEQSVGMYVDGIYYGRAQLARAPFLDLARVEVLRGPQNILMGKNSIAGAVSITTAKASQEFEASTQLTYEADVGERIADVMISGPVNDNLAVRFAARKRIYDGHIRNLVRDRDERENDEETLRLKLNWDVNDDLTAALKIEAGTFDSVGRQSEIIYDSPSVSETFIFTGRTYGEILDRTVFPDAGAGGVSPLQGAVPSDVLAFLQLQPDGSIINIDADSAVLNVTPDYQRHANEDYSNNETRNLTLNLDWFRDGHQFTSITGYMAYEYDELQDADYTGADLFLVALEEEYEQLSQEFRWISPVGESFEYIGGIYLQANELTFFDSILVDSNIIPQLVNAADYLEGGARGDYDPGADGSSGAEALGIGDAGNAIANFRSPRTFTTDSKLASAFLQATFNVVDTLRLTLGGRYTYENKEGSRHLRFAYPDGTDRPIGESDTAAAVSFAAERHFLQGERSESQFAPLINVQWDATDELMAYFTASRGFKSGGFDARSNATPSDEPTPANPNAVTPNQRVLIGSFEFEEEEATSYELGFKSGLLGGAAELNVAVFRTEFDDLQVSVFDGTLGFNVGNAATAISQGVELDGRIGLSEHFILSGGLAFLDYFFDDHLSGTCIQGQVPDQPNGINCDYSGKSSQYAADWSGNLLLAYENTLFDSLILRANLDAIFTDEYHPTPNFDDRVKQDAYVQFNGRLSLSNFEGSWDVALLAKNLTDEMVILYANDTPTAYTITEAATHHGFVSAPRTFALQLSYRWY